MPDEVLKAIEKAEKEGQANKAEEGASATPKEGAAASETGENQPSKEETAKPTEAEATTVAKQAKPTEEATATEAPMTTTPNTATEATTKPREVNGTVEKADQFTADKPATKAEIDAAKKEVTKKEYTVFPTPQKVTYGEGVTALEGKVNLVFSDSLDIYTRNRAKEILQANQVSYTTSAKEAEGYTIKLMPMFYKSKTIKYPLSEKTQTRCSLALQP